MATPSSSPTPLRKVFSSGNDHQIEIEIEPDDDDQQQSNSSQHNINLPPSIPFSRTKSTPLHTTTSINNTARSLGYAMRKVFSREEQSAWHNQETQDLVRNDNSLLHHSSNRNELQSHRVSSRIVDSNAMYDEDDELDEIGAELVLNEEIELDEQNESVANTMLEEHGISDSGTKIGGAYKLRKFLSSPTSYNQKKGSILRRTPSYEPENNIYVDDEEYEDNNNLSNPISLKRGVSLRRKKSLQSPDRGKGIDDEDLSTVAESLDGGGYDEKRKEYKRNVKRRRIGIGILLLILGITCVAIGVSKFSGNGNNTSASNNNIQLDLEDDNSDDIDTHIDELHSRTSVDGSIESSSSNINALSTVNVVDEDIDQQKEEIEMTAAAASKPTNKPSDAPEDTYTMFHLMADSPYDDEERYELMPAYIEDLQSDAEFLVHLGDLQSAKKDECKEYAYREASNILKKSSIPTFVLPGDNDINDCDDHEWGEEMWTKYFKYMDKRWEHSFDLKRWGKLDESFTFLHKQVRYIALNIVGGTPYSKSEANTRYAEHLEMIRKILDEDDNFKVLVLLGHADPECSSSHEDFFEELSQIVEDLGKPTIHFHGDSHSYYEVEGGDHNVDNLVRISLDGESKAPPLRVEIDVSRKNPIRISRRRSDLDVDCCSRGWPRHNDEL